jgi:hypothetical protein
VYKAVDDRWNQVISDITDKSGKSPFDVARNIAYEVSLKRPTSSIISELDKYGIKLEAKDIDNVK